MFGKINCAIPPDKINTIIGQGTIFKGDIQGEGCTRIDGQFEGDISSTGDVIIDRNGHVTAEIKAQNITIAGKYEGNIEANQDLAVKKTGIAHGKFKIKGALVVDEGAIITGNLEMELDTIKPNTAESGAPLPDSLNVKPDKASESDFDSAAASETEETVEQPMENTG